MNYQTSKALGNQAALLLSTNGIADDLQERERLIAEAEATRSLRRAERDEIIADKKVEETYQQHAHTLNPGNKKWMSTCTTLGDISFFCTESNETTLDVRETDLDTLLSTERLEEGQRAICNHCGKVNRGALIVQCLGQRCPNKNVLHYGCIPEEERNKMRSIDGGLFARIIKGTIAYRCPWCRSSDEAYFDSPTPAGWRKNTPGPQNQRKKVSWVYTGVNPVTGKTNQTVYTKPHLQKPPFPLPPCS